jgi:hypothetical protein
MARIPEPVRRMLTRLGLAGPPGPGAHAALDRYDARLDHIEQEQREIAARLRLLGLQADPRGLGRKDRT